MLDFCCCYPSYVSIEGYIGCCVFSLSDYRYLGDGGTDRREMSVCRAVFKRQEAGVFGFNPPPPSSEMMTKK